MIHVAGDGTHLAGISIKMPVNCQDGYHTSVADRWPPSAVPISIVDHVAAATLALSPARKPRRGTIGMYVHFTASGVLQGRLHVRIPDNKHRVGLCSATLKFTAIS